MSDLRLRVREGPDNDSIFVIETPDGGPVPEDKLEEITGHIMELLHALDAELNPGQPPIEWTMQVTNRDDRPMMNGDGI